MTHIIERVLIHFISSTFLVVAFYFALKFWVRKNAKVGNYISSRKSHLLTTAAILVFALLTLREPFDTYFGTQVWYKAIFDQISWFLGAAVSVFGLNRYDND